jgi:hypothetical protein
MPQSVHLIGRYDVWDLFKIPNILEFQNGLKVFDTDPNNIQLWENLFQNSLVNDINVEKIIEIGKSIIQYNNQQAKTLMNRDAFIYKFHTHDFLTINRSAISSQFFDQQTKFGEIIIPYLSFYYNGINDRWIYSMYKKEECDVDILEICKFYGGGGHTCACGFTSELSLFELAPQN